MKKYAIWDKKTTIITPIYEVLSPQEWMERYPVAAIDSVTVVCSAGEVNGGFFGTLGQMVSAYEAYGADFSGCTTPEEKLEAIEAWEDAKETEATEKANAEAINAEISATALASIAAQLEYQNMLSLEDVEV